MNLEDKPNILIIDDIRENITSLEYVLEDMDINILSACTGKDAMSLMSKHDFALVLMDVQMPKMNGYEIAKAMHNSIRTRHTPIIFVTAHYNDEVNALYGYESGAVDYMVKPVNETIIRSKINTFVELYNYRSYLEKLNDDLKIARDEAEKANNLKSSFLARMSHDIRAPMNGIIGLMELMLNTTLDKKQIKYTETAYKCGEELILLINDILDFSKIEAGELKLEKIPFDIGKIIHDVTDILSVTSKKNDVTLTIQEELIAIKDVVGDPHRVRQILINLVSNAIKFAKGGNVLIIGKILDFDKDNASIKISVKDDGIGISKDMQESIFDQFTQEATCTTRKFGGTGLGLSICSALVKQMGGKIGVKSSKGSGATFWFTLTLPIAKEDNIESF